MPPGASAAQRPAAAPTAAAPAGGVLKAPPTTFEELNRVMLVRGGGATLTAIQYCLFGCLFGPAIS